MGGQVWKYELPGPGQHVLEMPRGAQVLTVQMQGQDQLCLWALATPDPEKESRTFLVKGTGWDLNLSTRERPVYVGTVQTSGGALVWHVFEVLGRIG